MTDEATHGAAMNTDKEVWSAGLDYRDERVIITEGRGIGISVGGTVIVKPAAEWHRLAILSHKEGAEPVAWQERQAKRRINNGTGEITEWSGWYECKPRPVGAPLFTDGREEGTLIPMEWRPLYARATNKEAPTEPEGWQLVPNTATYNMLNAANSQRKRGPSSSGLIYRVMLAAAPRATNKEAPTESEPRPTAEPMVRFNDDWDCLHEVTLEQAAKELQAWHNAWPGGLEEVAAALRATNKEAPTEPVAWACTDYDGRVDVGCTKEEAKARAGEWCDEFFPLFANSVGARMKVTDEMVSRFLVWTLPEGFRPDGGITFVRLPQHDFGNCWPSGTNLLDFGQARAMLEYVLDAPTESEPVAAEPVNERVAFEAWASDKMKLSIVRNARAVGNYDSPLTEFAWNGWDSRAALKPEAPPEAAVQVPIPVEPLRHALEESLKLQAHYAGLLNAYDEGRRETGFTVDSWIARLAKVAALSSPRSDE